MYARHLGSCSRAVVVNLFHAVTHFAAQFDHTPPFRKFTLRHMTCSCVCKIENNNDSKLTYDITMLQKDSFFKLMHGSIIERDTCHKGLQITPQLNSRKSIIISMLATAIKYLIFNHSTSRAQPGVICGICLA